MRERTDATPGAASRIRRVGNAFGSLLAAVTIAAGMVAAVGCGSGAEEKVFPPDGGLLDLKAFLESAKTSGQATTKEAAAPVISAVHLGADYYIRSGQIEYIWGTTLADGPEAAGKVIAFQTSAASEGGWVLFQDGSMKRLTAEEFAAAPKATPSSPRQPLSRIASWLPGAAATLCPRCPRPIFCLPASVSKRLCARDQESSMAAKPDANLVTSGLDQLVAEEFGRLSGKRVGLVTHPAAVDRHLRGADTLLQYSRRANLVAIFGPEHGLFGQAQDLESVPDQDRPQSALRQYSLYGTTAASLRPTPEQLAGIDLLVVDLQDVGSRYYTFQATMKYCLEAAGSLNLPVLVLDRPNPLGGLVVEGPRLSPGYESFIGAHDIAIRHGLTIGELALLYQADLEAHGQPVDVEVIPCGGLRRSMWFEETGLPWVLPSPNMPTVDTAVVYPGQCLIEGTNLSEGRGTTRPFELCGAPWINPRKLAEKMNAAGLPGVIFRPVVFRPTFQKHAGVDCGGVQLHVTDREAFRPVRTSLALLAEIRRLDPDRFAWRTEEYEFVKDPIAIDLLFGSDRERKAIEAGTPWQDIAAAWEPEERAFEANRHRAWLYE